MSRLTASLALLCCVLFASSVSAEILRKPVTGKVPLKSVQVLSFAPEGILLIGDGRGGQILAVKTGDIEPVPAIQEKIPNIQAKFAARIGTTAEQIKIEDFAVNPVSNRAYFAILKQDDKQPIILTLDGSGKIEEFNLDKVTYVRLPLATEAGGQVRRLGDVAWAEDRVIASAGTAEEFGSKIYSIKAPLEHEAAGVLASAETYHVSHRRWETKAPMSALVPYKEGEQMYVVGAFACTPVVKYPLDSVVAEAKVKGQSMLELGSGNRPLDMVVYRKGDKEYVLANTFRFHHERRPFGPSPYWAVRIERSVLDGSENVNENAARRLKGTEPALEQVQMIESLHGVVHLDRLGDDQLLVLRAGSGEQLDLETVPLP